MNLSNLRPRVKTKRVKRVGRGPGSGHGKTSGRGYNGAGQRVGTKFYVGFEGGDLPFFRRIPKRGFNSFRKEEYQIVNLKDIERKLKGKEEVTPEDLKEVNLIKSLKKPVKILAQGKEQFGMKIVVKAHKFSRKAKETIEGLGGRIECLNR